MVHNEGPPLPTLLNRLANTPRVFLEMPRIDREGIIHVDAVVSDLLTSLNGQSLTPEEALAFSHASEPQDRNRLRLTLLAAWLLHDPWFRAASVNPAAVASWLQSESFAQLAALVRANQAVSDPDRREEFSRRALKALNLRPAGETSAQAEDRLTTLDSMAHQQVLEATRSALRRAEEVREAMRKEAAQRAAAKYSRE
jgi:hypothetical protein